MQRGVDRNIGYLLLTFLIIAGAAGYHNATTHESDYVSFGVCEQSLTCTGVTAGDMCIGIEEPSVDCVLPREATEWQRAETECGLDAQGICNENPGMTGMAWAEDSRAEWDGKRCTTWADEYEQVDLLSCDETFTDITKWSEQQQ